jgi:glutamate synthase (NADPH/NADH) small chain
MEHLVASNRAVSGRSAGTPGDQPGSATPGTAPRPGPVIDAAGKHVVIIGGGDTAADCLGVTHRQGAAGVIQLDLYPEPPHDRDDERDPWPTWPWLLRNYPAHEEGGERVFAVGVQEFVDDGAGNVQSVRIAEVTVTKSEGRRVLTVKPGSERLLPADLVLLAIGFEGTEGQPLLEQFGVTRNRRGAVDARPDWQTEADGVFVAGDMHRGASLIVWAIAEGRAAAAAIHSYLGGAGDLPAPVTSSAQPLAVR